MTESSADLAANVRSDGYLIAGAVARCPYCLRATLVVALMVPPGHETLLDEEGEAAAGWESAARHALLFYVELIPDSVRQRLQRIAPGYRYVLSPVTQGSYWGNHCDSCGGLLEDHDIFCEPEGAFLPMGPREGATIAFHPVDEPLQAHAAGYAPDPQFIEPPGTR